MRVAVIGTGGLGGYYGGMLARAGHEVACVARGAHLAAIRERGLTVRSEEAGTFTVRVAATDDTATIGPVDLVLFGVKTYDTDAAAALLPPLLGPGTAILSLQNGIETGARLARAAGGATVLGGVVYRAAHVVAPGIIEEGGLRGRLIFGDLGGGIGPRVAGLQRAFDAAGLATEAHPAIGVPLWLKFLIIASAGSVGGLTRLAYGGVRACPETMALIRGLMGEIDAVGRACGIPLPPDAIARQLAAFAAIDDRVRSSLATDLARGKPIELDAFNGTVVRLGRERAIPTPLNFAVYAALKPYAAGPPAGG